MQLFTGVTLVSIVWITARSSVASLDDRRAYCANPTFIPCTIQSPGTYSGPDPDSYSDPTDMLNELVVEAGHDMKCLGGGCKRDLNTRQIGLCCSPEVECRMLTSVNVPFCYVR